MHAPAPFESGEEQARGNPRVKVAKFASFADSGKSFVARFGHVLRGLKDPKDFAKGLVLAGFNTGDASNGGRAGFENYVVSIIETVKVRMQCK